MKPSTALDPKTSKPVLAALSCKNAAHAARFPGDFAGRQPVHTVYGGAHLFKSDSAKKLGELSIRALTRYAPDAVTFARAVGMNEAVAHAVYDRVVDKLKREAVEDFRIDFEDGYGNRPDAEEDGHAVAAALEVAKGLEDGTLPPFIGIRIKTFSNELAVRSVRTMDIFLTTLIRQTKGRFPNWLCVTLPKVVHPGQAAALAKLLDAFERKKKLAPNTIKAELMVETPQSIIGADGTAPLRAMVDALGARCTGAHFGTYDYTASCNITAAQQRMRHPACDFAKSVMQVTLAGTGVTMSDGATNVMPVGPHRAAPGEYLSAEQDRENVEAVRRAWRLHYDDATHSLVNGFYQGWDLHPAQLPTRYAAVYAFFISGLPQATARLKNFIEKAAQATLVGDVFDDAATGQGLLNYFLRARNCGAITAGEAAATGLTPEEFATRSFLKILEGRR
ncbi:MAG TPA: phosphoenolpyruvate kinase [Elusimicrobiota bacterium]|jgi:citrate lyase beta subunit|nr:phosphoenolpyruvate kinase [Elusimicrobiota bacterium]